MTVTVAKDDVIAFRLRAHHLGERLDAGGLLDAAGACGIQDSPPGSALLALHARVRDVTRERVEAAVQERALLRTWSLRGSPYLLPTADAAVFTRGVLPPDDHAARGFLLGAGPAVDEIGVSLTDAVELTTAEVRDVLSGRRLAIDELGAQISARIAARLPERQRDAWRQPGPYAAGQPLGEGLVHFCLRILTLRGIVCFAPRAGNKAPFVLVDEWLGHPLPEVDADLARAELVRRHLRCYGPSTRAHFAAWVGIRPAGTDPWWRLVEDELTPVELVEPGGRRWVLTEDVDALRSSPAPGGVRLLPPRDPYTQLRDRETILDERHHREVWRTVGDPGTVLARGKVVGTWRPRRNGRRLTLAVTAFDDLADGDRRELEEEAEHVARLRGATSVTVDLTPRAR